MAEGADISGLVSGLGEFARRQIEAAVAAVEVFGEHVIGDAQQLTPVDTGALKASGTGADAEVEGTLISKTIGFNVDYAAAVHERLDLHHEQGEAKFLETALRRNTPKFVPFVAARVKAATDSK